MGKVIAYLFAIVLGTVALLSLAACDQVKQAAETAGDAVGETTEAEEGSEEATAEFKKSAEEADDARLLGVWYGAVTDQVRYDMEMTIERVVVGEPFGRTTYTGGLNCGALNTLSERRGPVLVVSEIIDTGTGCSNGVVEIRLLADGRLEWKWRRDGASDVEAEATLTRRG